MSEEIINSQNPQEESNWEAQLQARANEFVNQRIGSLKAEIDRLQSTITDISSKLAEQSQPVVSEEETSGLLDHIRQWFSDSNAKAEQEFEKRLAEAKELWESESRQTNEEEFQKRLEQACADAAAVARREAEAQMEELREQLEASRKALTLAVSSSQAAASSSGYQKLKSAIENIDAQRTQSDALAALVRHASQFAPRVVFFVVKGGDAVGWKAAGFDNGLNDDSVRSLNVPTQQQSLLREALTTFSPSTAGSGSTEEISSILGAYGSPSPDSAMAIPLVVRGKAAAVLYADSGTQTESSINAAALESLMQVASMGIELLPIRRGVEPVVRPSGPPAQLSTSAVSAAAAPATALDSVEERQEESSQSDEVQEEMAETGSASESESLSDAADNEFVEAASDEEITDEAQMSKRITEELTMPEATAQEEEQSAQLSESSESENFGSQAEPDETSASQDDPHESLEAVPTAEIPVVIPSGRIGELRSDKPKVEPVIPPPPPPAPPFMATSYSQNETDSQPESTVAAPAFTSPVFETPRPAQPMMSVPAPASETEQRAHNDARRFARLLVSEIKLYNAAKVNEGRRNQDLYERLKDEIDRSRKVYDKRVSPAVATKFDYFYDELVQTLAEGDVAKLGPNCPGPIVIGS